MDLKLKVKLKAYTKAMIPDVSKFIEDAPKDNKVYGRKDGDWVNIDSSLVKTRILPRDNNSGLDIEPVGDDYLIGIRKWEGKSSDIPNNLEPDTTYYGYESTPNYYLDGGTAYSSTYYDDILEQNEEVAIDLVLDGGNYNTRVFNLELLPIDSKGEYNGN